MKNIVIGTTFIDIKGFPESQFMANGRNAGEIHYIHGGVARNIVENLGRCGVPVAFVSGVDKSPFAADILGRLQGEGVDTEYMIQAENSLGTWLAIFDDEGDVVSSISKRPDLSGLVGLLDEKRDALFQEAKSVSIEIDMDPKILDRTFRYAHDYGVPVYAVVSNMRIALEQRALEYPIDCLVCNLQEAELITGVPLYGRSREEILKEIRGKMSDYSVDKMVVTLGGDGAVYYDRQTGESGSLPAVETEICDTTGAGDAFFSGVVMGLTGGKNLEEACRMGAGLAAEVIATMENVCPREATVFS